MSKYFPLLVNQQNCATIGVIAVIALLVLFTFNDVIRGKLRSLMRKSTIDDRTIARYQNTQILNYIHILLIFLAAGHQFVAYVLTTVPPNWADHICH